MSEYPSISEPHAGAGGKSSVSTPPIYEGVYHLAPTWHYLCNRWNVRLPSGGYFFETKIRVRRGTLRRLLCFILT